MPLLNKKILFLVSVDQYEAGKRYRIDPATADEYIAKGYCEGEYSREYTETELLAFRNGVQRVVF